MSPNLANDAKLQRADMQTMLTEFGAVKSIAFKGVGPARADIYDVVFDNHATEWRLLLGADGKTESIGLTIPP